MPFWVTAEELPPPAEPLPFPPGRGVAPAAALPPPPGPREPAVAASFTFDKESDPRVANCVATTLAPTAARPTPMPTPARSPPLIDATPPSIAEEILGDIQQTQRNITAPAASSNPARPPSRQLPLPGPI